MLSWAEEISSQTVINAATCLTFSAYAHDFLPCTIFLLHLQVCGKKKRERKEKEETERFTTAHTHLYSFFSLKVVLVKYRERLSAWSNIKRKGKKRWGGAPVILLVTSVI